MSQDRSRALLVACLALMLGSFALGVLLVLTIVIPLRDLDPVAATVTFLLAVVAFTLAGVGVSLAVLSRRK
jgi:hypothetical protein